MIELRDLLPLIVLATAGIMLFTMISEQWTANEEAERDFQYEYMDCVPLSTFGEVETISGPAEIFGYCGEDWVRMTDVGTLHVKTASGSKTYEVGKAHLGLVLYTGQSNSIVCSGPQYFETPYTIEPGKAFIFGYDGPWYGGIGQTAREDNIAECEILDLVTSDGTLRMANAYPVFCKDYLEEQKGRLLILNTGIGGQSIKQWDIPTGRCSAWTTTASNYLQKALEEDGRIEVEPLAVLWSQGESDSTKGVDWYYDRMKILLERFENGTWIWKYPCVLTSLPRHPETISDAASAQILLAEDDPSFIIATSLPLHMTDEQTRDGIHYTQEVYGWIGEAFARSLAEQEGFQPVKETIVLVEDLTDVMALPSTVTAYGTSGAAFELSVTWTENEGSYVGELSGNPAGTVIKQGLQATATLS